MNNIVQVKEIKVNAHAVWSVLCNTVSGMSIQELCKQLKMTFSEVMDAIRWLSRDHNIGLQMQNQYLVVVCP